MKFLYGYMMPASQQKNTNKIKFRPADDQASMDNFFL